MPQSETARTQQLREWHQMLNTPQGKAFVNDLSRQWDAFTLLGDTPEKTAHQVGLRDAFKHIKSIQSGELINE